MLIFMFFSFVWCAIYSYIIHTDISFDFDALTGIFGCFNPKFVWLHLFNGLFLTSFGALALTISLKFVPVIVFANALILEIPLSQIIGCIVGIDKVPGFLSLIGFIIASLGFVLLAKGSHKRETQINNS